MDTVVVIPAYDPDEKLLTLVEELLKQDFDILVVDDGSDERCAGIFSSLEKMEADRDAKEENSIIKIIHNEQNLGKGASLKNGMRALSVLFPNAKYFVTADADGQHLVKDMCRVREMLKAEEAESEIEKVNLDKRGFVITTRILKHAKTPIKSRIGNALSRFFFALANNHYLPDNQSGLRGFSVRHIDWMLNVPGDKYDYELNVLLIAEKQGIKVRKFAIEALYFDNNKNTHFKPLLDTLRIYRRFFATEIFAVIAVALNILLVLGSDLMFGYGYMFYTCLICWGIYALLYFVIERYTLFRKIKYTPGVRRMIFSVFRYTIYALICLAVKSVLGWPFTVAFIIAMILTAIMEFYILKVSYDG